LIELYVDGSSTGKVGDGGWGFVIVKQQEIVHTAFGSATDTTNNRMELSAAIEGLRFVASNYPANVQLTLFSDSQYVIKGIVEWFPKWKIDIDRGKTIKNQDLWLDYAQIVNYFTNIDFKWIRGHSGHVYNELCDQLAKQGKKAVQLVK
jgi:ribonuclease HI/DNA polymerase-3 subunit epsilon